MCPGCLDSPGEVLRIKMLRWEAWNGGAPLILVLGRWRQKDESAKVILRYGAAKDSIGCMRLCLRQQATITTKHWGNTV